MADSAPIHSVVTTLNIIEHMANASGPVGVSEIAGILHTTRPKVYRHLRTLLDQAYVAQDPLTDKYHLTVKLFHIGQAIAEQTDFLAQARRVMPGLRDRVNLTITVGQFDEDGVRVLDILKHRSEFEISARPGAFFDFHCSAQGKVALAFGPQRLWRKVEGLQPLKAWTVKTIVDIDVLKAEIEETRSRGWGMAAEQVLSGINAVAAPIFDTGGTFIGTITMLGSIQFLPADPQPGLITAILEAADEISRGLGYKGVARR